MSGLPQITHYAVRIERARRAILADLSLLNDAARNLCRRWNLTVVSAHRQFFGPGSTVTYILSESELSFHTWPEHGMAYINLVCCGECPTPSKFEEDIRDFFGERCVIYLKRVNV